MLLWAVAVLAFALSADAACTKTYSVVSGDTCLSIPQKNSISSYQLTKLNPTLNCNSLSVGQSLCVIDSTYNCQPIYTVKSGDGCWAIANSYGITTDQLIANNPQLGTACAIQPGQNLCVAGGTTTTPATTTTSSAAPTGTVACTKSYTVKSGDNCNAIAVANGVSNYQLTYLNPSMNCNGLAIGQPVYTVKSGDTCYAIATANSITTDQLIANNPNVGSNCALGIGISLCIKGGSTTTSVISSTTSSAAPTSTACTRLTTIQSGETCDTIGARSGISRYWLGILNPTINSACSNIISGQALCVDSPKHNCSSVYQITGLEGGCQKIADTLKISLATLLALNPNVNAQCSNIYANEVICTAPRPTGTPTTACTRRYTIVPGDTCQTIAAKNSLTSTQLTSLNAGLSCNALTVGASLCSYSPSISICPKLIQIVQGDTCFDLATNVTMSLDEWKSINQGINCDALQLSSLVCSAQGNSTLPEVPSGANPTALPLCGAYDKKQKCCTMYSVAADLFNSPLCQRANGCQENCIGDSGVVKPTTSATPTWTITPISPPTAVPSPCQNCTSTECCSILGVCEASTSWYCKAANGCTRNCDTYNNTGRAEFPPSYYDPPQFSFPSGNFSAWGGNPCGSCNQTNSLAVSPSGKYCCAYGSQCVPQEFRSCNVQNGCLYNCISVQLDPSQELDCDMFGKCDYKTVTILQPYATPTSAAKLG